MSVIKSKNIDLNNIIFSNPKPYSSGKGNSVRLYYNNKSIFIQTPRLLSLYGLNLYTDEKYNDKNNNDAVNDLNNIKSINLVLQYNNDVDKINRVNNFKIFIKKFDNLISKQAQNNTKSWLHTNKKLSDDCIDALQKKSLYYSYLQNMEIDNSKPPSIKVKIPFYNNKIQDFILLDKDNNKLDYSIEELQKKLKGEVIVKCILNPTIYIVNQNFGVSYNIKALKIIDKHKSKKTKKIVKKNSIDTYFNNNKLNSDESLDSSNNLSDKII